MHRAKLFSGKKKREQLLAKREKKRQEDENDVDLKPAEETKIVIEKTNSAPPPPREGTDLNRLRNPFRVAMIAFAELPLRLRTVFDLETKDEVERRKMAGREPLNMHLRDEPWKIADDLLDDQLISIPLRPSVTGSDKEAQERKEKEAFEAWRSEIKDLARASERLNYFEQNIEVWRQLWRTMERSDVLLLITDARYPLFHFSRVLYNHVVAILRKPLLLVLNKCDLVAPEIVEMWQQWFHERYPSLKCIAVASFHAPVDAADALAAGRKRQLQKYRTVIIFNLLRFIRGKKRYDSAEGLDNLVDAIRELGIKKDGAVVPILPFRRAAASVLPATLAAARKAAELKPAAANGEEEEDNESDDEEEESSVENLAQEVEQLSLGDTKSKAGQLGTIGHPNVGKSSLINGLMGRKVVSTSRTPGHTKHFQTIFLTPELQLMDCPGLVFPAVDRPKPMQVLCGLYPLAQLLIRSVPIERIYALRLPPDTHKWTPWAIAEALALQRGYTLARGGRPDIHKAGREILTDCLDGRIVFSWPPPNREAAVKEFLKKEEEKRRLALLTPPTQASKERENETEEEAEARRQAKREKKAEAKRVKRLGPGHTADPRAVSRVLAQAVAAKEEEEEEPDKPTPTGKLFKDAERAREYAERQAAKQVGQGRRKRGNGPLDL